MKSHSLIGIFFHCVVESSRSLSTFPKPHAPELPIFRPYTSNQNNKNTPKSNFLIQTSGGESKFIDVELS